MPHTLGRPTKYDPSLCEKVIEYMSQGDSKVAVAAKLGVSRDTLYEWAKEHPTFSDSIKRGVDLSQAWWEDLGKELVLQGQGNAVAWIYNMKSRFKEDWSDIQKTEVTGKDGSGIQLNLIAHGGFIPATRSITSSSERSDVLPTEIQGLSLAPQSAQNNNGSLGNDQASSS